MKIKFNILLLICFGMIATAQTAKKPIAKTASIAKKPVAVSTDGIFAEFETSKGKIIVQLEYKNTNYRS